MNIIQVDESEHKAEKEVEKENRGHQRSPLSSRRPALLPRHHSKLQKQKRPKHDRDTTPVFKVPRPLAHHSTPAASDSRTLFGFEELDSPLTLSPVTTTPSHTLPLPTVSREASEEREVTKPSPYSRLKGTYDIPFKKKTPKRLPPRRKKVHVYCYSTIH